MKSIATHKMVTMKYAMKTHLPDSSSIDHPEELISFVFGVETQVPTLEKALVGRREGEKMGLAIPPSEIYGDHDPLMIREIPQRGLIKPRLKEGQFYRQMKRGSLLSFKALEIRPDTVLADFNSPMAGIRVSMDIEILDVRDATGDEIQAAAESQKKKSIGCG